MGFLDRFLRRRPAGPRLRPEALRSVLLMADEGAGEVEGDPMELVMRAFHDTNRELFAALFRRDLWEQVQLGFGTFPRAERTDARRLAELVHRSHGADVGAYAQQLARPLRAGAEPAELTLLTVHRLERGATPPAAVETVAGPLAPLLDLTSPLEGRAK